MSSLSRVWVRALGLETGARVLAEGERGLADEGGAPGFEKGGDWGDGSRTEFSSERLFVGFCFMVCYCGDSYSNGPKAVNRPFAHSQAPRTLVIVANYNDG